MTAEPDDAAPGVSPRPGFSVTDDIETSRFLLHRDGELVGFADYHLHEGVVVLPHVETLHPHRGQGYGATLVDGVLEIVRSRGGRVAPVCPFAADHIRQNPQHHDLLA